MSKEFIQFSLGGEQIKEDNLLTERFIEPPFSVLDTRTGRWMNRKRMWIAKGIKSELGRFDDLTYNINNINEYKDKEKEIFNILENKKKDGQCLPEFGDDYGRKPQGTSVFDPVLCEIMYRWFCDEGGAILDPFAGGSVRGIVANYLGYKYTGLELRKEQVESNITQAKDILKGNNQPEWIIGDSNKLLDLIELNKKFDFIFSCPPYMDLEIYSDHIDDLSNKGDDEFIKLYNSIIQKSCYKLKRKSFAAWVIGDVRDRDGYYKDFIGITKAAFKKAGMKLYNDIVLINVAGSAPIRAANTIKNKKVVKVHQNILVFFKP